MLFDRLAGAMERHPKIGDMVTREFVSGDERLLKDLFSQARLFEFPPMPEDTQPLYRGALDGNAPEEFHLPYPVTCVDNGTSVVLLMDGLSGILSFGLSALRLVAVFHPTPDGDYMIHLGGIDRVRIDTSGEEPFPLVDLRFAAFGRIDKELKTFHGVSNAENIRNAMDNGLYDIGYPSKLASDALMQLAYAFSDHQNFVFESAPATPRKTKPGRIARSQDRPLYTILRPEAIRKIMGYKPSPESGRTQGAHERRAHYRTFRSERYKAAKGTKRFFPATWVGPTEAVVGRRHYKVILEAAGAAPAEDK